jgi:hypothetical protein
MRVFAKVIVYDRQDKLMKLTPHPIPSPTPTRGREQRFALSVILIAFIIAGLLYGLSTPFLDVSDEVRHYAMVEQLAQGKGLPIQNPAQHGFYEQEGSQPPLYYAVMALVALPFDRSDFMQLAQFNPHARLGRADATNNFNQLIHTPAEAFPWHGTVLVVQIMRLLGVLMGAITVLCTYAIARELTPLDQPQLWFVAPLAASFTAFNPMFVFISASVNNDTLAAMLSSLGLLLGVRVIRRGLNWRNTVILGVVLGCAALAKSSALALAVIIPLAIWVAEWIRSRRASEQVSRGDRGIALPLSRALNLPGSGSPVLRPVPKLALMGVLIAGIAGWWYVRNAYYYNGDFTGTTMMATISGARATLPSLGELLGEWGGFRQAYWGLFGAVNIPMERWIYSIFDVLLVLAGVGILLLGADFVRLVHPRPLREDIPQTNDTSSFWIERGLPVLACLGVFGVEFAALVRWTSITLASQGRLLFPVIAVISTFIALGLTRLCDLLPAARIRAAPAIARVALSALPGLLLVLTLICPFAYIRPAYALPAVLNHEGQLPADMVKTELRFEDGIRWIGYRVETPRVQPGDVFIVTLYWQALKPVLNNYSAFVRLYGRADTQVFLLDTYPGGGMYQTTLWQPGQVIIDRYRLRIADTLTNTQIMPSVLRLDVGFWNFETKQFLNTYDVSGNPTGRQRYPAGALASSGVIPATHTPALAQAYVSNVQTDQISHTLTVSLTWSVTTDFTEDYTVFVHLFDARGDKVAQADGPASNDDFSTRWWRKGDTVADPHTFNLPDGLPPGEYTLKYGLYKLADGTRMPAFDTNGQPIDEAALSEVITIK